MRSNPLKVVHVSPTYLGPDSLLGGAERYVTQLAKAMAQQVPTRLVSFGEKTRRENWGNLEVHIYRPFAHMERSRANPISLRFLSSLQDADILHCHQPWTLCSDFSILKGAASRKPVFVTDLGGASRFSLMYHLPIWRGIRCFLPISEYSRRQFARFPIPSRVIYGGVDPNFLGPPKTTQKTGVLFVGRIRPAKGIHSLIEAVPSQTPLTVVGPVVDPLYLGQLRSLAKWKQVFFETKALNSDLTDFYSRALVTVLPSQPGTELLGLVLLESMACGTPVICSRVGGMPEIVEEGVTGFLIPPNDPMALREKIQYVISHPKIAEQMGRAGRDVVLERFTWDHVVEQCLNAYREFSC